MNSDVIASQTVTMLRHDFIATLLNSRRVNEVLKTADWDRMRTVLAQSGMFWTSQLPVYE